ncbi:probable cytochrome P450 6a13 [Planococcus citri]|uniref:probable cytochrome P450 6a13 n=1 Tax=Planococcus citri TaxID=170843 RepID=UPI0031F9D6EE
MLNFFNLVILAVISALLYVHRVFKKSQQFFDKNAIPYKKPTWLVGNMGEVLMLKKPLAVLYRDLYQSFEPHRLAGVVVFHKSVIMVRDPELIKHVLVKDFSHFVDRGIKVNADVEPLNNHLLSMKGEEWKNLRVKLTSTFTSGKMKLMFPLVKDCGDKLTQVLSSMPSEPFDVKDLCARFTTDVIGTCAFGIEIHSLENPDSEFRSMGNQLFEFRYRSIIRTLFPDIPKKIIEFFNLRFIDRKVEDFFYSIVENTIKHREENKITRYDFIDLLLSLKNQTMDKYHDHHDESEINQYLKQLGDKSINKPQIDMTLDVMAAQTFLFFTAGFETSSTALAYLMFELALNKEIQDKVRDEVNSVIENNAEGLTYEALKEMPYVDMAIAEILRKYPPGSFLARECTQTYKIPDTNIIIPEKTAIIIPVFGIHMDPKYYEKPEEFYPEHFTEEAKANRPHYTYMPFGDGPRVCIAERFAKMQVKIGLISMIRNFSYEISPKMTLPLTFLPNFGLLAAKNKILLQRKPLGKNEV